MKDVLAELELLVRSSFRCLGLVSAEEDRCTELAVAAARRLGRPLHVWSLTTGWTLPDGTPIDPRTGGYQLASDGAPAPRRPALADALVEVREHARGRPLLLLVRDLHASLDEPRVVRALLDLLQAREDWAVLFSAPGIKLPSQLEKEVALVDVPLPDEAELHEVLMRNLRALASAKGSFKVPQQLLEAVVRAALGLTRRQADCVFRRAIQDDGEFTEDDLERITAQKRQIIAQSGVLEFVEQREDLRAVGGLDGLKGWLRQRQAAFSEKARAYGLPQPKGVFLLGVQGCGKSLVSKAIAGYWHMPLLRLDVGALFSSYIGKTEENLRSSLRVAESIAPCALWVDEIEKGFAGVSGSGSADAGTSARVFGAFITWMQEKARPVFVVATANSIEHLPPELLRKGRFDEVFFVDLPTPRERLDILRIHIERRNRQARRYDLERLAQATDGFSGAELEQAIVAAMYRAFPEDREFTTQDVLQAVGETVPLARTMADKVQHLRAWASQRARWATTTV
ncbi:MAG: AAA family ATPase [Planctomycetota bacterium]|nr:AAA family ATPase [Planctomycetota bacterium]